jgi:HSP20 family protein
MPTVGEKYEGDWCPVMDMSETEQDVIASVELPGMGKDDIKVSVHDDVLTVTGEKHQEKKETKENVHRVERSYGCFKRSVAVPADVDADKVKATFKDGILKVTLPKLEVKKAKQIPVEVSR